MGAHIALPGPVGAERPRRGAASSGASGIAAGAATTFRWNPADKNANLNLSNSDRTAQAGAISAGARAIQGKSTGKWYYEWHIDTNIGSGNSAWFLGYANSSLNLGTGASGNFGQIRQRSTIATFSAGVLLVISGGSLGAQGTTGLGAAGIIRLAIDYDAGNAWGSTNSGWLGDPANGIDPNVTGIPADTYYPFVFFESTTPIISIPLVTAYAAPAGFLIG